MHLYKFAAIWRLIIILVLLPFSNLKAQQNKWYEPSYVAKIWDNKTGLPQNTVFDIQKDENGFLWLATEEGLVRFDGKDLLVYNNSNLPSLTSSIIYDLTPAKKGGIWAANEHAVIQILQNKVVVRNINQYNKNSWITCISEDDRGRLWIGTNAGDLHTIQDNKVTEISAWPYKGKKSIQVIRTYQGGVLIGTDAGLFELTSDLKNIKPVAGFENKYIRTLAIAPDNTIWIGTKEFGLFHKTPAKTINYTEKDGLPELFITAIRIGPDSEIWVGTNSSGVHQFTGNKFVALKAKGLPDDGIRSIFFIEPDLLWVGTSASGLVQLRPAQVHTLSPEFPIANKIILPVYQHKNGDIWVGTAGSGINRITGGKTFTYNRENGLSADLILTVGGNQENIYIGTPSGLNRFNLKKNQVDKVFTVKDGLASDIVLAVFADSKNRVWVGSRSGGVHTITADGKITRVQVPAGLSSTEFISILEDKHHNIWLGTRGAGVVRIASDGKLTHFNPENGLPATEIYCFYEDKDGNLWMGTDKGLVCFTKNRFVILQQPNGLNFNIILTLVDDGKNALWLSGTYGLQRISFSELVKVNKATGKKMQLAVQVYNTTDGMNNAEANGGIFPAGYRMQDGTLWFPTVDGVAIIDPVTLSKNDNQINISIKALRYGNKNQDLSKSVELPPGVTNIEIDYTSIDYINPSSINFYYRLKGIQKEWQFAAERRTAYFTSLEPGNYTFEVKAEKYGKWSETAELTFTIEPFFNQTIWFKGGLIFLLFLAGFFARAFYVQNRQEAELKGLVEARTKDLQESNNRFKLVNKATSDVIWDYDIVRNKIYWGDNIENLFGHSMQDKTKHATLWNENLHPEDAEGVLRPFNAAINGSSTKWQAEYRFRKANKQYAHVIDRGYILRDEQGKATRILGAMQDVTRLKEEEQQLKLLESVITNSSDGVVITEALLEEPGPRILYVNNAFSKMTGYQKEELIGKTPRMLQGPKSDKKELDKLKEAMQNRETCEIEIINYRKNGETYFANMNISPVTDQQGNLTHFISIERDSTERREYIKAIQTQNAKLREIAWIQSHKVRAPLAKILGLINLLQNESEPDTEQQELLSYLNMSGLELDAIIREIVRKSENIDNQIDT